MTPTKPAHPGHDDHGRSGSDLHNEEVAHEHSDVNVRGLLIFCIGLAAVAAIVHVAMYGLFVVFERQAEANDPVMSPLARPAGQLPPEPRLLTDEPQNLQRFLTSQSEGLKGIDAAKKQLLQQGLPVRANAVTDPWLGQHSQAWGGSSSGRAIPLLPGGAGASQVPQPPAQTPEQPAQTPPKSDGH
jgi:hypothetical protein